MGKHRSKPPTPAATGPFIPDEGQRPKKNDGARRHWDKYRESQRFQVLTTEDGQDTEVVVDSYEELAQHLNLSISTLRQYFAGGGGNFKRTFEGKIVIVTRGRTAPNGR